MKETLNKPNPTNILTSDELFKRSEGAQNVYRIGKDEPLIPIPCAIVKIREDHDFLGASFEDIKKYIIENPSDPNLPQVIEELKHGSLDEYTDYSENHDFYAKDERQRVDSFLESIFK